MIYPVVILNYFAYSVICIEIFGNCFTFIDFLKAGTQTKDPPNIGKSLEICQLVCFFFFFFFACLSIQRQIMPLKEGFQSMWENYGSLSMYLYQYTHPQTHLQPHQLINCSPTTYMYHLLDNCLHDIATMGCGSTTH